MLYIASRSPRAVAVLGHTRVGSATTDGIWGRQLCPARSQREITVDAIEGFQLDDVRVLVTEDVPVRPKRRYDLRVMHDGISLFERRKQDEVFRAPRSEIAGWVVLDRKRTLGNLQPQLSGFGFGLKGASEGLLVAETINSLRRAVRKEGSLIAFDLGDIRFLVEHGIHRLELLPRFRAVLGPEGSQSRVAASRAESPHAGSSDIVAQLERLGALRANGMLNEQEFLTAKARLLKEPADLHAPDRSE